MLFLGVMRWYRTSNCESKRSCRVVSCRAETVLAARWRPVYVRNPCFREPPTYAVKRRCFHDVVCYGEVRSQDFYLLSKASHSRDCPSRTRTLFHDVSSRTRHDAYQGSACPFRAPGECQRVRTAVSKNPSGKKLPESARTNSASRIPVELERSHGVRLFRLKHKS